jgi:uncharacterized protein (TIGR00661 family)
MFKLWYGANSFSNSKFQLERFLNYLPKNVNIKIAGYNNLSCNVDWNLNSLHSFRKEIPCSGRGTYDKIENIKFPNQNIKYYLETIDKFNPDLIISDCEFFTTYAGLILKIPVWQCSPMIGLYGLKDSMFNKPCFGSYGSKFRHWMYSQMYNLVQSSEKRFVYSFFGDLDLVPDLLSGFEFIRPYHKLGIKKENINLLGLDINNNKNLVSLLKYNVGSKLYSNNLDRYNNLENNNITKNYFNDLAGCDLCVSDGAMTFLADAFYNKKFSLIIPNINDIESVFIGLHSQIMNVSKILYSTKEDLTFYKEEQINPTYNKINYLHEKLTEFMGE